MLPPKRFDENPNTATQVKKNGTEKFGMDQDGVAKKISAEDLLKIENIENGAKASVLAGHVDDKANPHAVTKAQVGLGNVTNLAPADLPLSDAEIGALALKADKATTYTKTEVDVTIDALDTRLDTLEGTGAGSVAKAIDDALEPIEERLTGLDTLVYEGKTYMVSKRIENGHLVTTYTEVN